MISIYYAVGDQSLSPTAFLFLVLPLCFKCREQSQVETCRVLYRIDTDPLPGELEPEAADGLLRKPVHDPESWAGVTDIQQLGKPYAQKLFAMSSIIPDSYLQTMHDFGYGIQPGARMLFPGNTPEWLEIGFAMSGATTVG